MSEWIERCHRRTLTDSASGFEINFAGINFSETDLDGLKPKFDAAMAEMAKLEAGAIKNPDENRKVTHFSDRIAYPQSALFAEVESFAAAIRNGELLGGTGKRFDALVVNGIGGSALGPQLMQFAVNGPYWNELSAEQRKFNLKIYFLDNTDSAEFADLLAVMNPETTLQLVISKSGGTQETRNNMIAMEAYYNARGLKFADYAAAITMKDSQLDKHAREDGWLKIFEMADSIGGRTSETAIVGHVPAALTGVDFKKFLSGACAMDEWTRQSDYTRNPAAMLAGMWFLAGNGKGDRNMVIVPYSDRLILLSRYLQQLVMESLGKELDLDGKVVHQGLNVFGNKGGTDAHAFIQQLNDGRDDFFATFIEVLKDSKRLPISGAVAMGDYLHGFLEGLRSALRAKGRQTISITLPELTVFQLGQIIALYERAVAIYAELIHINAFHQPGVQAYKLAAKSALALGEKLEAVMSEMSGKSGSAAIFATAIGESDREIEVAGLLNKKAANSDNLSREFDAAQGCWIYSVK